MCKVGTNRFDRSPEDLDLNVVIIHLSTSELRAGGDLARVLILGLIFGPRIGQ